jgi:glutamate 5-kinase
MAVPVRPVVVKVGTSTLCGASGRPQAARLAAVVSGVAALHRAGRPVVLVTSGAIATGAAELGRPVAGLAMAERQAMAAVGQPLLMRDYTRHFAVRGLRVAQVLLTAEDLAVRRRYINARNTMAALLRHRIVPVVNENDTVATEEIRIGDNDTLSAQVAVLVAAELLVILSDVDGLFTGDPRRDPSARRIPEVRMIAPPVERLARRSASRLGTGGMQTKLTAARVATAAGCTVVTAGERLGTWFLPAARAVSGRKRWLVAGGRVRGRLVVDAGAARALREGGRSLLPSGIRDIEGAFDAGDLVAVVDPDGREVGRGITAHDHRTLDRMKGRRTGDVADLAAGHAEVIHRDNLVLSS